MAIGAGTLTLADYAQMSNQPAIQRISYSLINYANVMQDVPLIDRKTLISNGTRFEGNLPTVNWSQLNAEGVTTKGTPTAYQEQAYIIRNYIDVDKFIVEDMNQIQDPRGVQNEAYLQALTYDLNFKFFKNDHVTGDANAPVGLRARIDDAALSNKFGVRPENKLVAGVTAGVPAINLTMSSATAAIANTFLEALDHLLWCVDSPDGSNVILYMNDTMKRRLNFALRLMGTSGGLTITQDQFSRTIAQYKGAIIRDPGYKADQSTQVITSTETSTGAADTTGTYTSIYAVNYSEDHFFGWQFGPPNMQDLGLINNGAIYRTLIDWAVGLMNASTRSLGRLAGIQLA